MKNITGELAIYKRNTTQRNIRVKCSGDLFDDPVIFKATDEYIIFKRIGLDYRGKTVALAKMGNWYTTTIAADVPLGNFAADEGSNEDELIFYFE